MTTVQDVPGTQPDEAPLARPHLAERGLIVLPDGTVLPFVYGGPVVTPGVDLTEATVTVVASTTDLPRRIGLVARAALRDARAAGDWVVARSRTVTRAARGWFLRANYRGRHHVERRWFGRARSTAEVTGAFHRNYRAGVDLQEGDLPVPVYWVGWAYRVMEVMRAYDEALHPTTGHRFVCS